MPRRAPLNTPLTCASLNTPLTCAQDILFTPDEMSALEAASNLPSGHTRTCPIAPPPPSPPPRAPPAVCEVPAPLSPPSLPPGPLCLDSPLTQHRYFDEQYLILQGAAPQVVGDCSSWCTMQVETECEARVAFQVGETFGCGFDPGVSRCSLFAANPLVVINTPGFWAVELQCNGRRLSTPRVASPQWLILLCSPLNSFA